MDTRWSDPTDTPEAVLRGYKQFQSPLQEIAEDFDQNSLTKHKVGALASCMDTIEVCFMCDFWNDILRRFNWCTKLLQSTAIELSHVIELLRVKLHII